MKFEIEVDLPAEVLAKWNPAAWRVANVIILEPIKQYREPVLPADYGKECEFSDDGFATVLKDVLTGYESRAWICETKITPMKHARIEVTDEV